MLTLIRLFFEFFKTGLFAVGGGLATMPFLYNIAETTKWFTKNDLERMEMHKPYSAVVFEFEPDGTNYFVLDEDTFKKMLDKFEVEWYIINIIKQKRRI